MTRFEWDGDYEGPGYENAAELYEHRALTAIYSRRGRAALRELREALMALPQHALIEGAVCRVPTDEDGEVLWKEPEAAPGQATLDGSPVSSRTLAAPAEVCVVGAHVWWQKVKAGMAPDEAFVDLPALDSEDDQWGDEMFETAWLGQSNGLTYTLAWELQSMNDETWGALTPEERWQRFVAWIDEVLAAPPLDRGGKLLKGKKRLGHSWSG